MLQKVWSTGLLKKIKLLPMHLCFFSSWNNISKNDLFHLFKKYIFDSCHKTAGQFWPPPVGICSVAADSVRNKWFCTVDIFSLRLLPPLHTASRDKYMNWRMADRAGCSIDIRSVPWRTGSDKALFMGGWARQSCGLHCIAGRAKLGGVCVVIPIYPCSPPSLPHTYQTVVGVTGGGQPLLPKSSSL
jgi:hypothetical protein